MFQLEEIKEAHAKVKTGSDFPRYIQDLKKLGVIKYETFVEDGHTIYFGNGSFQVTSLPKYARLEVEKRSNTEKFAEYLIRHQKGLSDYPTFCKESAETGVEKWVVDITEMTCTYYDKLSNQMLQEKVPTV